MENSNSYYQAAPQPVPAAASQAPTQRYPDNPPPPDTLHTCTKVFMIIIISFEVALRTGYFLVGNIEGQQNHGIDKAENQSDSHRIQSQWMTAMAYIQIVGIVIDSFALHATKRISVESDMRCARIELVAFMLYQLFEFCLIGAAIHVTETQAAKDSTKCKYWKRHMGDSSIGFTVIASIFKGIGCILAAIFSIKLRVENVSTSTFLYNPSNIQVVLLPQPSVATNQGQQHVYAQAPV